MPFQVIQAGVWVKAQGRETDSKTLAEHHGNKLKFCKCQLEETLKHTCHVVCSATDPREHFSQTLPAAHTRCGLASAHVMAGVCPSCAGTDAVVVCLHVTKEVVCTTVWCLPASPWQDGFHNSATRQLVSTLICLLGYCVSKRAGTCFSACMLISAECFTQQNCLQ
jgi:hypothetical protein